MNLILHSVVWQNVKAELPKYSAKNISPDSRVL